MLINAGKLEQENLAGSSCDGLIVHQQQLKGTLVTQSYLHTHTHIYTHAHTHCHKKRKDSLETRAVLLIFSLNLKYLGWP